MNSSTFFDDLYTAFRDEAQAGFERALEACLPEVIRRATLPPYVTAAQLADLTGLSLRQISYLRAKGCIPFVQRGRTVRYPTTEALAYLEEGRVPARADRS